MNLPHDIELEQVILGTAMVMPKYLAEMEALLKPEYFFVPFHRDVVNAIHLLIKERSQVDQISITKVIANKTDKTAYQVTFLTNKVDYGVTDQKLKFLAELYFKRKLMELSFTTFSELDKGKDFFDMKDYVSKGLLAIQQEFEGIRGEKTFSKSISEALDQIDSAMTNPDHVSGIVTGNKFLDAITGGWQNTDLIIVAARPGMGKTARALNFLKAAVESGKKCLMMSLEMSIHQLIKRLLAEGTGLDLQDINRGRLSDMSRDEIQTVAEYLKKLPIKVNDNGRTTIYDIAAKCRIMKTQGELDFLIVDYLQICKGLAKNNLNRNDLIGMFTSEFKDIAKECDIPVMVLCQLSRKAEASTDKRPDLEHLRESGSIEQDADLVGFVYRPSYYTKGDQGKEKDQKLKEMSEREYEQYSEFIIAKHRNGKITTVKEYFEGSKQKFRTFFDNEEKPLYQSNGYENQSIDYTKTV